MEIDWNQVKQDVAIALKEDIGNGDVSAALMPETKEAYATVITREAAVLCGSPWFEAVFKTLDPQIETIWHYKDGETLAPNQSICELKGSARHLLTGERTALNFLQTLSGTATRTHRYVEKLKGTHCRLLDTRKTIPGLRYAQKYATRCGGAENHRLGLYDAFLIKENHILAFGSITKAIQFAQNHSPELPIEVEVETLKELVDALNANPHRILLDNFSLDTLKEAVRITQKAVELEASGNITLKTIRKIAKTGVDCVSVGRLTKNIRAIDLSMRFL